MNENIKYVQNIDKWPDDQITFDFKQNKNITEKFKRRVVDEIEPRAENIISKLSLVESEKFIKDFNNTIIADLEEYGPFDQDLNHMKNFVNEYVLPKIVSPKNDIIINNTDDEGKVSNYLKSYNERSKAAQQGIKWYLSLLMK